MQESATGLAAILDLLRCPHCLQGLNWDGPGTSVWCGNGHAFDVAKQGYVNLLTHGAPKNADSPAMVAARAEFLDRGHFAPLAQALSAAVAGAAVILDAGAGTGYYLGQVLQEQPHSRGIAADLSVAACRRAAQVHPRAGAIVADTWQGYPILGDHIDAIMTVFAPRNFTEFSRLLSEGGQVVVATPAPDHLLELRGPLGLLEIEAGKEERLVSSAAAAGFTMIDQAEVRASLLLDPSEVQQVVLMGPNAFHTDRAQLTQALAAMPPNQSVSLAVDVSCFARS